MWSAKLKVLDGKQAGKTITLAKQKFLIGRETDCHLRPHTESVSRHHCVFTIDDYTLRLRDLGSTNGTFVNGERIHRSVILNSGDRVSIGGLEFEVLIEEKEPAASAQPEGSEPEGGEDEASSSSVVETDTTELSGQQTVYEMPVASESEADAGEDTHHDTHIFGHEEIAPAEQQAAQPQGAQVPPGYAPQGGYPYPPQGQPGMPYPPQPGMGYPQPGMPYMPYGGMPYPPQQPGGPYPVQLNPYPPQGQPYPPGTMPPGPQPPPPQQPGGGQASPGQGSTGEEDDSSNPPVHLPPPDQTGAAPSEPPQKQNQNEESQSSQGGQQEAENPSHLAADIIKKYRERRPGTE